MEFRTPGCFAWPYATFLFHSAAQAYKPAFIPWTALKDQFGPDYGRMNNFKAFFRSTLRTVLTRYQDARVELDDKGMTLRCSPAPVRWRYGFIRGATALPPSG